MKQGEAKKLVFQTKIRGKYRGGAKYSSIFTNSGVTDGI
jgi:hypothetical protein